MRQDSYVCVKTIVLVIVVVAASATYGAPPPEATSHSREVVASQSVTTSNQQPAAAADQATEQHVQTSHPSQSHSPSLSTITNKEPSGDNAETDQNLLPAEGSKLSQSTGLPVTATSNGEHRPAVKPMKGQDIQLSGLLQALQSANPEGQAEEIIQPLESKSSPTSVTDNNEHSTTQSTTRQDIQLSGLLQALQSANSEGQVEETVQPLESKNSLTSVSDNNERSTSEPTRGQDKQVSGLLHALKLEQSTGKVDRGGLQPSESKDSPSYPTSNDKHSATNPSSGQDIQVSGLLQALRSEKSLGQDNHKTAGIMQPSESVNSQTSSNRNDERPSTNGQDIEMSGLLQALQLGESSYQRTTNDIGQNIHPSVDDFEIPQTSKFTKSPLSVITNKRPSTANPVKGSVAQGSGVWEPSQSRGVQQPPLINIKLEDEEKLQHSINRLHWDKLNNQQDNIENYPQNGPSDDYDTENYSPVKDTQSKGVQQKLLQKIKLEDEGILQQSINKLHWDKLNNQQHNIANYPQSEATVGYGTRGDPENEAIVGYGTRDDPENGPIDDYGTEDDSLVMDTQSNGVQQRLSQKIKLEDEGVLQQSINKLHWDKLNNQQDNIANYHQDEGYGGHETQDDSPEMNTQHNGVRQKLLKNIKLEDEGILQQSINKLFSDKLNKKQQTDATDNPENGFPGTGGIDEEGRSSRPPPTRPQGGNPIARPQLSDLVTANSGGQQNRIPQRKTEFQAPLKNIKLEGGDKLQQAINKLYMDKLRKKQQQTDAATNPQNGVPGVGDIQDEASPWRLPTVNAPSKGDQQDNIANYPQSEAYGGGYETQDDSPAMIAPSKGVQQKLLKKIKLEDEGKLQQSLKRWHSDKLNNQQGGRANNPQNEATDGYDIQDDDNPSRLPTTILHGKPQHGNSIVSPPQKLNPVTADDEKNQSPGLKTHDKNTLNRGSKTFTNADEENDTSDSSDSSSSDDSSESKSKSKSTKKLRRRRKKDKGDSNDKRRKGNSPQKEVYKTNYQDTETGPEEDHNSLYDENQGENKSDNPGDEENGNTDTYPQHYIPYGNKGQSGADNDGSETSYDPKQNYNYMGYEPVERNGVEDQTPSYTGSENFETRRFENGQQGPSVDDHRKDVFADAYPQEITGQGENNNDNAQINPLERVKATGIENKNHGSVKDGNEENILQEPDCQDDNELSDPHGEAQKDENQPQQEDNNVQEPDCQDDNELSDQQSQAQQDENRPQDDSNVQEPDCQADDNDGLPEAKGQVEQSIGTVDNEIIESRPQGDDLQEPDCQDDEPTNPQQQDGQDANNHGTDENPPLADNLQEPDCHDENDNESDQTNRIESPNEKGQKEVVTENDHGTNENIVQKNSEDKPNGVTEKPTTGDKEIKSTGLDPWKSGPSNGNGPNQHSGGGSKSVAGQEVVEVVETNPPSRGAPDRSVDKTDHVFTVISRRPLPGSPTPGSSPNGDTPDSNVDKTDHKFTVISRRPLPGSPTPGSSTNSDTPGSSVVHKTDHKFTVVSRRPLPGSQTPGADKDQNGNGDTVKKTTNNNANQNTITNSRKLPDGKGTENGGGKGQSDNANDKKEDETKENKSTVNNPPANIPPVNNPPVNNSPVNNPPVNNPPVIKPPANNPPVNNPPVNKPPVNNPPVNNPPVNNPPVIKPPVNNPPVNNPPVIKPPVNNPPVNNPPVNKPPVNNPPVIKPPVNNPPVNNPPVNKPTVVVQPAKGKAKQQQGNQNKGIFDFFNSRVVNPMIKLFG